MDFIFLVEDEQHRDSLSRFYNKSVRLSNILFKSESEVNNMDGIDSKILIGIKEVLDRLKLDNHCIYLTKDKSGISLYQDVNLIFEYLDNYTLNMELVSYKKNVIGFAGVYGGVGTTTLSIHMASYLSKRTIKENKTILISLEEIPSGLCFLKQANTHSLSNLLFLVKNKTEKLSSKIEDICLFSDEFGFYYFSDIQYLEDLMDFNINQIKELCEILTESNFTNIVFDFGTKISLLNQNILKEKFLVINQDLNQYKRLNAVCKYITKSEEEIKLIINKRKHDLFINESYLRFFDTWNYVYFDFKLNVSEEDVISQEIISSFKDIL